VNFAEAFQRNRAVAERLLGIQGAAVAAGERSDRAAGGALIAPVTACLDEALALGEPGLLGLAYRIAARVHLVAGDTASAIADCLRGETVVAGEHAATTVLAAHPRLEDVLELRKVRLEALAAGSDSATLAALAQDTIRVLEIRRARLHDPYQEAAFLADRTVFYEMFAFGSFKQERWDDLLTGMDLLKARAPYLKRTTLAPPREDPEISARLAAANAILASAAPDAPAYRAAAEQRRLLISLRAVTQSEADEESPDAIPRLSVTEVQATLAAGEAVVSWVWISREVLLLMAFDAARSHVERIVLSAPSRAELDAYVGALRAQELDPATLDGMISRLAEALLPAATRAFLAPCQRLVLSPHRSLHVVPFHAARSGSGWLIERWSIRYAASVGSLLVPRRQRGGRADGGLFALGIDEFAVPGESWPPLKQAEAELADVVAVWKTRSLPVVSLAGPRATLAAWRALGSGLERFRCLHLATHGASVFDREAKNDPLAARLILQDGALDALALSQLRLGADIVVLSACNSGQRALAGRGLAEYPGDDNFGLQAALFQAGTSAVIGALWPVLDEVAPIIMTKLHEGLAARQAPDLALQTAVLDYLRRPDARREAFAWGQIFLTAVGPLA
jgi:CHAT domain-containing protein